MNVPGSLPKTGSGNQYVFVLSDRYMRLRAILVTKVTRTDTGSVFIDHLVTLYGAPTHLLIDNGPHLDFKFLEAVCDYI